ncbi:DNA-directed RNA polymerase II subunit RPB1-like [Tachysurus fulvidraco]|uniref:DNA-directed RNA polymerase II subunit RPB1-like n=1 Tax=Tachysurus fulvidraco TaxID=1234273 RepID=UPI001FEEE96B|nr:DNA-directed RNA polymerase II subunit RPB1-like [Tachysurus fulvidraco]
MDAQSQQDRPDGRPMRPSLRYMRSYMMPYARPVPTELLVRYRRYQLDHITRELITFMEQLSSPNLPEHPFTPSYIVRRPQARTSSTQTDGCPHAVPERCCSALEPPASPSSPSTSSSPPPGSPDYSPTSPVPGPSSAY